MIMFNHEQQIEYWSQHDELSAQSRVVAQKNLMRLCPELFENVVFLEDYRDNEDDVA